MFWWDFLEFSIKAVLNTKQSLIFWATAGLSGALFAAGWLYLFYSVRDPEEEDGGEEEDRLRGNAGKEGQVRGIFFFFLMCSSFFFPHFLSCILQFWLFSVGCRLA